MNNNLVRRGKRLSFLLRHDKNYPFDEHGWREISDLITNHGYSMDELKEIVATNNKQRFEFSEDMTRIRARQGHSVHVDVELEEKMPPDTLYHGTAKAFLDSIMEKGIIKGIAYMSTCQVRRKLPQMSERGMVNQLSLQ